MSYVLEIKHGSTMDMNLAKQWGIDVPEHIIIGYFKWLANLVHDSNCEVYVRDTAIGLYFEYEEDFIAFVLRWT